MPTFWPREKSIYVNIQESQLRKVKAQSRTAIDRH